MAMKSSIPTLPHSHGKSTMIMLLAGWAQRMEMQIITVVVHCVRPPALWSSKLCGRPITWPDTRLSCAAMARTNAEVLLKLPMKARRVLCYFTTNKCIPEGDARVGIRRKAALNWDEGWTGLNVYYDYGYVMRRIFHLLLMTMTRGGVGVEQEPPRRENI